MSKNKNNYPNTQDQDIPFYVNWFPNNSEQEQIPKRVGTAPIIDRRSSRLKQQQQQQQPYQQQQGKMSKYKQSPYQSPFLQNQSSNQDRNLQQMMKNNSKYYNQYQDGNYNNVKNSIYQISKIYSSNQGNQFSQGLYQNSKSRTINKNYQYNKDFCQRKSLQNNEQTDSSEKYTRPMTSQQSKRYTGRNSYMSKTQKEGLFPQTTQSSRTSHKAGGLGNSSNNNKKNPIMQNNLMKQMSSKDTTSKKENQIIGQNKPSTAQAAVRSSTQKIESKPQAKKSSYDKEEEDFNCFKDFNDQKSIMNTAGSASNNNILNSSNNSPKALENQITIHAAPYSLKNSSELNQQSIASNSKNSNSPKYSPNSKKQINKEYKKEYSDMASSSNNEEDSIDEKQDYRGQRSYEDQQQQHEYYFDDYNEAQMDNEYNEEYDYEQDEYEEGDNQIFQNENQNEYSNYDNEGFEECFIQNFDDLENDETFQVNEEQFKMFEQINQNRPGTSDVAKRGKRKNRQKKVSNTINQDYDSNQNNKTAVYTNETSSLQQDEQNKLNIISTKPNTETESNIQQSQKQQQLQQNIDNDNDGPGSEPDNIGLIECEPPEHIQKQIYQSGGLITADQNVIPQSKRPPSRHKVPPKAIGLGLPQGEQVTGIQIKNMYQPPQKNKFHQTFTGSGTKRFMDDNDQDENDNYDDEEDYYQGQFKQAYPFSTKNQQTNNFQLENYDDEVQQNQQFKKRPGGQKSPQNQQMQNNNFLDNFNSSNGGSPSNYNSKTQQQQKKKKNSNSQKEKKLAGTDIVIRHNTSTIQNKKQQQTKPNNIALPFQTSLGNDFLSLFATTGKSNKPKK